MPSKNYTLGKSKKKGIDLELPSGETCLVRRPGPQTLIAAGVLDSFDSLTALVGAKLNEIDGKTEVSASALQTLAGQQANINAALGMVDKVVEFVVLEPKVLRPIRRDDVTGQPFLDSQGKEVPLSDQERDEKRLYTDDVDLADRMFILQFSVGGSADLERFRDETASLVGSVEALEGLSSTPK